MQQELQELIDKAEKVKATLIVLTVNQVKKILALLEKKE